MPGKRQNQWLMKKAKRSLLSKKVPSSDSTQSQNSLPAVMPLSLYQSIVELPLSKFIDVVVDNELEALIISGHPTELQLSMAWKNILDEYTSAIGTSEYKTLFNLYKELQTLKINYDLLHLVIDSMRTLAYYMSMNEYHVDQEYIDTHKQYAANVNAILKTNIQFNYRDTVSHEEALKKCKRRSASIKISIDLKQMAYDAMQSKSKDESKMDRQYFDSLLITISDHAKYEITEAITVSKFCERIRRYNTYCESLKKSVRKNG